MLLAASVTVMHLTLMPFSPCFKSQSVIAFRMVVFKQLVQLVLKRSQMYQALLCVHFATHLFKQAFL